MTVHDTQVLVLADEDSQGGKVAPVREIRSEAPVHQYGFEDPTARNAIVTAEGNEFDVVAKHRLTGHRDSRMQGLHPQRANG